MNAIKSGISRAELRVFVSIISIVLLYLSPWSRELRVISSKLDRATVIATRSVEMQPENTTTIGASTNITDIPEEDRTEDSLSFQQLSATVPNPSGYCPIPEKRNWDSKDRSDRFPSVNERVCHYMSVWYDAKYHTSSSPFQINVTFYYERGSDGWGELVLGDQIKLTNCIQPDEPFHVWLRQEEDVIRDLAWKGRKSGADARPDIDNRIKVRDNLHSYAGDIEPLLNLVRNRSTSTPLLAQFGDQDIRLPQHLPVISKFRKIRIDRNRAQPILWYLESGRHYEPLYIRAVKRDIPWKAKKNTAIWRGIASGRNDQDDLMASDYLANKNMSDYDVCQKIPRCQLVWAAKMINKTDKIDAGFTYTFHRLKEINGVSVMAPSRIYVKDMLRYKMLISVEGNDVASGLKWNLFSNSVVLMAPPTKMTYALENLLEQWVHYVPLASDFSDLEEKVDWVLSHEEEAQRIAQRSRQFIHDMFFHPDAQSDSNAILHEIAGRYVSLWSRAVERYVSGNGGVGQVSWRINAG